MNRNIDSFHATTHPFGTLKLFLCESKVANFARCEKENVRWLAGNGIWKILCPIISLTKNRVYFRIYVCTSWRNGSITEDCFENN
ncbi:hypothetical protein Y032_0119g820 [Ancylostoma ceylanicum]|uniref:Uncharacterized protein n=1 Tax=Ancylostoma ceylanicum TaxID=53326 RepID=A0A016TA67_9BILA|nr:hypothetical protein Y032_0119g820 [Ancylostoma ceylanicum]